MAAEPCGPKPGTFTLKAPSQLAHRTVYYELLNPLSCCSSDHQSTTCAFLTPVIFRFEQVPDSELHLEDNQYAILSHRWGADEDEVSFEDIRLSKDFSNKKGFKKVEGFYKEASAASCRYGWIDTCCINKGNSTELSEAINSMYPWYQGSKICIAYLEDVPQKQLTDSVWFDRGWTLQELISPKAVTFFDNSWKTIGTKIELIADLSRKTRMPESILSHATKLSTCSIA